MPFNRWMTSGNKTKRTDQTQTQTLAESTDASAAAPEAAAGPSDEMVKNVAPTGPFYEKDNQARRILRPGQANDFWSQYEENRPNIPFLRYVFDTQLQATDALLAIGCVHQAEDTGHLICTEPITMGCYRAADGRYEVFLAGEKLDYQTWSEAAENFSSRNGKYRNQLRPETYERFKSQRMADQVLLQKEYYEITPTETIYYQIFEASNFASAKNFLLQPENVVTKPHHYIHVVTPRGTFIRDINGIHE